MNRKKIPPPCGCQIPVRRPVAEREGRQDERWWCQQPGALWRVTLAQVEIGNGKYNLVCGYHRAFMQRRGMIVNAERVTT